jgi:hypothetical protein
MSEVNHNQDPRRIIAERTREQIGWIMELAQVIGGPEATVEDALQVPVVEGDTARDDAIHPDWTPEQTEKAIEVGRKFGFGAQETVPSGVAGGTRYAEGGKPWKIMAEANAIEDEPDVHTVVFGGSPFRHLGDDELKFVAEKGIQLPENATELDFVMALAKFQCAEIHNEPVALPFGYEIAEGNNMIHQPTGQWLEIGKGKKGRSVQVVQVAGEKYLNEQNEVKERFRPSGGRMIELIAEKRTAEGDTYDPIALATSSTYPSRVPDVVKAGLDLDPPRQVGVLLYGRAGILALGAPVPKPAPLNHLPGDLRLMHDKLQELLAATHTDSL